jgi:hypothetical protein
LGLSATRYFVWRTLVKRIGNALRIVDLQAIADAVIAQGNDTKAGDRTVYVGSVAGVVGYSWRKSAAANWSDGASWEAVQYITVVVQKDNCSKTNWRGNEIVTIYPSREAPKK